MGSSVKSGSERFGAKPKSGSRVPVATTTLAWLPQEVPGKAPPGTTPCTPRLSAVLPEPPLADSEDTGVECSGARVCGVRVRFVVCGVWCACEGGG